VGRRWEGALGSLVPASIYGGRCEVRAGVLEAEELQAAIARVEAKRAELTAT
jgi:hypothetical protein